MRALDVIKAEHRTMWRVANALGLLAEKLAASDVDDTKLHTVELIVEYFENFTERFHHHKEETLLYDRVRRRTAEGGEVLDRISHDHDLSPRQLTRMRALATAPDRLDARSVTMLAKEIVSFCEHMQTEEQHLRSREES